MKEYQSLIDFYSQKGYGMYSTSISSNEWCENGLQSGDIINVTVDRNFDGSLK